MLVRLSFFFFIFASFFLYGENLVDFQEKFETSHTMGLGNFRDNEKKVDNRINLDNFAPSLSAETEPLASVGNCINVISGEFFQVDKDLQGTTIDPLNLVRFYDSGSTADSLLGYGFGSAFPLLAIGTEKGARHQYGMISERENSLLLYRTKSGGEAGCFSVDPRVLENGYTNFCRSTLSGKTNIINKKALFRYKNTTGWTMFLGDGSKRSYTQPVSIKKVNGANLNFPTKQAYLLEREVKANGNQLHFTYQEINGKAYLKKIKTLNRTGKETLNTLTFERDHNQWIIKDDLGHTASYYQYEKEFPLKRI